MFIEENPCLMRNCVLAYTMHYSLHVYMTINDGLLLPKHYEITYRWEVATTYAFMWLLMYDMISCSGKITDG